ncbi:MAG: ParB/RepB/Spo0J family partition protein [Verrucomicrobia bacterium]|nr:ParB/RepB/Spo0J family partition protein [Verrucomicrobiota bacterium]
MAKNVLGRGLGSLIAPRTGAGSGSAAATPALGPGERVLQVGLAEIAPSPLQPRREFKDDKLQELVDSIREQGILQPLVARKVGAKFELIAGERRWRAAKLAGLAKVPVIEREATDQQVVELALIENLQRADLNPIEEARGFQRLAQEFKLTQEEIAKRVGRSRAGVANALRLIELDPEVQAWLVQDMLSVGHAKVLLGLRDPAAQRSVAEAAIRRGATVREIERMVSLHQGTSSPRPAPAGSGGGRPSPASLSPHLARVQDRLRERLQTQVTLTPGAKKGVIAIEFYGLDDLQRVLDEMGLAREDD